LGGIAIYPNVAAGVVTIAIAIVGYYLTGISDPAISVKK
jgi:hypothetical protein